MQEHSSDEKRNRNRLLPAFSFGCDVPGSGSHQRLMAVEPDGGNLCPVSWPHD